MSSSLSNLPVAKLPVGPGTTADQLKNFVATTPQGALVAGMDQNHNILLYSRANTNVQTRPGATAVDVTKNREAVLEAIETILIGDVEQHGNPAALKPAKEDIQRLCADLRTASAGGDITTGTVSALFKPKSADAALIWARSHGSPRLSELVPPNSKRLNNFLDTATNPKSDPAAIKAAAKELAERLAESMTSAIGATKSPENIARLIALPLPMVTHDLTTAIKEAMPSGVSFNPTDIDNAVTAVMNALPAKRVEMAAKHAGMKVATHSTLMQLTPGQQPGGMGMSNQAPQTVTVNGTTYNRTADLAGGSNVVGAYIDPNGRSCVLKLAGPEIGTARSLDGRLREVDALADALREAETGKKVARLNHPNLLGIEGASLTTNGKVLLKMPKIDPTTMHEVMRRLDHERSAGRISPAESEQFITHVIKHVSDGLAEMQKAKIVHLDLKNANIFVGTNGEPTIADWGSARSKKQVEAGDLPRIDNPRYRAPEFTARQETRRFEGMNLGDAATQQKRINQIDALNLALATNQNVSAALARVKNAGGPSADEVGPAADMFSFATAVYELEFGKPPFEDPNGDSEIEARMLRWSGAVIPNTASAGAALANIGVVRATNAESAMPDTVHSRPLHNLINDMGHRDPKKRLTPEKVLDNALIKKHDAAAEAAANATMHKLLAVRLPAPVAAQAPPPPNPQAPATSSTAAPPPLVPASLQQPTAPPPGQAATLQPTVTPTLPTQAAPVQPQPVQLSNPPPSGFVQPQPAPQPNPQANQTGAPKST